MIRSKLDDLSPNYVAETDSFGPAVVVVVLVAVVVLDSLLEPIYEKKEEDGGGVLTPSRQP
jgi:hypothetical protein